MDLCPFKLHSESCPEERMIQQPYRVNVGRAKSNYVLFGHMDRSKPGVAGKGLNYWDILGTKPWWLRLSDADDTEKEERENERRGKKVVGPQVMLPRIAKNCPRTEGGQVWPPAGSVLVGQLAPPSPVCLAYRQPDTHNLRKISRMLRTALLACSSKKRTLAPQPRGRRIQSRLRPHSPPTTKTTTTTPRIPNDIFF
jgi:hypothetical protein